MRGARWAQSGLLEAHPEADVRVYAIFFEATEGDRGAKDRVAPDELLDDPRVTVFWDEEKLAGRWFDEHVTKLGERQNVEGRVEWDAFILYDPRVKWESLAEPPIHVSWGRTIYTERERLLRDLSRALGPAD